MATDIDAIVANLRSFHDMTGKSVLHVGAGGGQLIGYADQARSVLAVDPDPEAVSRLKAALRGSGLAERFRVVQGDFQWVSERADLVFFEFCLHEMDDPAAALHHARSLTGEILVVDHEPDSPWAWHTCEEDKAARSWAAVRRLGTVREASFRATQHFDDHPQLLSRVEVLGPQAVERSRRYAGQRNIRIGMGYAMALLRREAV
jgi:ubiquinone/menaquinone biosynthesis C-methylase UbiE